MIDGDGQEEGPPPRLPSAFDLKSFLDSSGTARTITTFAPKAVVFSQGDAATDVFYLQVLARNVRIEEDLVDQLFNSSEKRLARALLLMARYGMPDRLLKLPRLSQETLAEMNGTTRSRVNFFMHKFRDLGFIDYNGDLKVNASLLTVVLHD